MEVRAFRAFEERILDTADKQSSWGEREVTESEAWLRIARKCVRYRNVSVFLCNEVEGVRCGSFELASQMSRRLELFRPKYHGETTAGPWWYPELGEGSSYANANDQRALACCFLAVMTEEEEK